MSVEESIGTDWTQPGERRGYQRHQHWRGGLVGVWVPLSGVPGARYEAIEFGVCPVCFQSCFGSVFLEYLHTVFFPFRMGMITRCHCVLEDYHFRKII